jgi:hypothetical protein
MPAVIEKTNQSPALLYHKSHSKFYSIRPQSLGGGSKWFGRDAEAAARAHGAWLASLGSVGVSQDWKSSKEWKAVGAPSRGRKAAMETTAEAVASASASALTVSAACDALEDVVRGSASTEAAAINVRWRLKLFREKLGSRKMDDLKDDDFRSFKLSLKGYKPEYINNILVTVRRLINSSYENGYLENAKVLRFAKANLKSVGRVHMMILTYLRLYCQTVSGSKERQLNPFGYVLCPYFKLAAFLNPFIAT